jgi:peptidoglycan/xylan/chitin deacetylase (PgdA/CDA1 family)
MTCRFFCILALLLILGCGGDNPTEPTEVSPSLITFSFDDGWRSTYENAFPVLERSGFKATAYIITGRFENRLYVGRSEVHSLASRGHEIGSHTVSHSDLTTLPLAQTERELRDSRDELLKLGVGSVSSFAYPFGGYDERITKAVRDAGYLSARSVKRGYNTKGTDRYSLQVQNLGGPLTIPEVRNWIDQTLNTGTWLILMIHHVDETVSEFSVTPSFFQEVVNYVSSKRVKVVTVSEGARLVE